MKLNHKVILCNWHNEKELLSGPCNVFYNLSRELLCLSSDIISLSPETCHKNFKKCAGELLRFSLKENNNIIIVNENGFKLPIFVLLLSRLSRKNKFYLISHGIVQLEDKYSNIKHEKYYFIEKILHKFSPNTICVSNFLREKIKETFNRNNNIYVVYNGIDKNKIIPYENKPIEENVKLIMTGGIKGVKGIFELLECIKIINSKNRPYKCYLEVYGYVDDDDILNKFKSFVHNEGLSQYVKYGGLLEKDKLNEKYKEAHFSIATSWFDTFNMSVVESMACGTPAIVSNRCGASEIIVEKENGFTINMDGDYKNELIDILDFIWKDKEAYSRIRQSCLKDVEKLSWNNIAIKYLETTNAITKE